MSSSSSKPTTNTSTQDLRTTNTINAGLGGDISDALVAAGNYGDTNVSSVSTSYAYEDLSDRSFNDSSDNSFNVDLTDASDRSSNDYSDRSFNDNSDRSFSDSSDRSFNDNSDNSVYLSSDDDFSDYSDNSLTVDLNDSSDRSIDNSVTTVIDGGAFAFASDAGSTAADLVSGNVGRVLDYAESQSNKSYSLVGDALSQSLDYARDAGDYVGSAVDKVLSAITASQDRVFDLSESFGSSMIDLVRDNSESTLQASNDLAARSLQGAMQIKAGQTVTEPANQTVRELGSMALKAVGVVGAIYLIGRYA